METPNLPAIRALRPAWNKGRIVGQKRPLKPKHVWAVRVRMAVSQSPEQPLASAIGATIRTDRLTLHHPRMRLMISSSIWDRLSNLNGPISQHLPSWHCLV